MIKVLLKIPSYSIRKFSRKEFETLAQKGYRYSLEEKMNYIQMMKQGATTISIEKKYGVDHHNLKRWLNRYEEDGITGLQQRPMRHYSKQFKVSVVKKHMEGTSLAKLCEKYDISNEGVVQRWVTTYCKDNKLVLDEDEKEKIKYVCKTTIKERINIVEWTIDNQYNYSAASEKYGVSYAQVYSWVKKFMDGGKVALVDRRGKRRKIESTEA